MNGTAKQERIITAVSRLREKAIGHPTKWKMLTERRIRALNEGQKPKVLAVGPRVIGGLSARYLNDTSYSGKPGKVFEVTTSNSGWLDKVGAGSVFYAVKHLGVKKVDVWGNGGKTQGNTARSLMEAVGNIPLEIREFSIVGSRVTEVGLADAAVVCCSDSRVQAHDMYDNVVVVSNAGNILSHTAIEVMTEVVEKGVPILMIMGHTKCGAVGAAVAGNKEKELEEIMSVVGHNLKIGEPADAEVKNAVVSAGILKGKGFANYYGEKLQMLQGKIRDMKIEVMATFFDLATGEVEEL